MSATAVENPPGQPQPVGTPGSVQDQGAEIGSQNLRGTVNDTNIPKNKQNQPQQTPIQTQDTKTKETPDLEAQPQSKDERHAARKIQELSEERLSFARLAIESNEDAIYKIAESDPKLAEKILKEYDYGTESLEELLAKRANPEIKPKEIERDAKIQELEKRVLDETIKRLQKDHSDLKDDLEQEFRDMYSNPAFAKYDETQKLNIARAASGKQPQGPSNEVLLEMLKQQEGSISKSKGGMQPEKKSHVIPQEVARYYRSAGVTPEKMEKYLPSDIDEQIERMFSRVPSKEGD